MYIYIFFIDNATTVHCELYIRSFGSISPVTMVSTHETHNVYTYMILYIYIYIIYLSLICCMSVPFLFFGGGEHLIFSSSFCNTRVSNYDTFVHKMLYLLFL